jgi:hypothetical protein
MYHYDDDDFRDMRSEIEQLKQRIAIKEAIALNTTVFIANPSATNFRNLQKELLAWQEWHCNK